MACEGPAPLTIAFTATPGGGVPPYTYSWSFGVPGGTSTDQNPEYTYTDPGDYTAVCTITDACGNTRMVSAPVTVEEAGCDCAAFQGTTLNVTVGASNCPCGAGGFTVSGSTTLTWNAGNSSWDGSLPGAPDGTLLLSLSCTDGVYALTYGRFVFAPTPCAPIAATPVSATCDPLNLVFTMDACSGTPTVTITP